MAFKKPNAELAVLLDESFAAWGGEKRKMFGCPAWFIQGNMCGGVFGDTLFLRLKVEDREAIQQECDEAVRFEPLPGKALKEYVQIPESRCSKEWLDLWIPKAVACAQSVGPKKS